MAWDLYSGRQEADQSRALDQRFLLLERRLRGIEQKPMNSATQTTDFVAHEGETIFVASPLNTAGLAGLLPAPKSANRGALIHLACQTTGALTLRTVSGTINGQLAITRQQVGSFTLVCDGATGWWVESLGLPRPRDVTLQDWFCSGTNVSAQIGALGWNVTGAAPAISRVSTSMASAGKLQLATGAVLNAIAALTLGDGAGVTVATPADVTLMQWVQTFNAVTLTKRVFIGLASTFATAPASVPNSLGFLYDSSIGANWLIIARFGSTGTPIDTGVPASTADGLLSIWQQSALTFRFYAGNQLLGTIAGGLAVSSLPMNVGVRVETLAASATSHRVGYFGLTCRGLGAPYLADEFVKG